MDAAGNYFGRHTLRRHRHRQTVLGHLTLTEGSATGANDKDQALRTLCSANTTLCYSLAISQVNLWRGTRVRRALTASTIHFTSMIPPDSSVSKLMNH